uniref:transmembrane protein 180 n=1 Tax=Myxine glutinosa TaxID=7769 RepID=UPI0035902372
MAICLATALSYGALAFCQNILHNVFLLYYVDVFVTVYHIDKLSFWLGETVFLVWNSVNDPLFGWMSDKKLLVTERVPSNGGLSPAAVVQQRLRQLGLVGPLFAFSFLTFWVSWASAGLQFVCCLCLYDAFLTAVTLQHNALLADMAVSVKDRVRLSNHNAVASALASASVFASTAFWSRENPRAFRLFCVALAVVAAIGFVVFTHLLRSVYLGTDQRHNPDSFAKQHEDETGSVDAEVLVSLRQYIKQLSGHRNLLWFVIMNLIQVFHCHFNSNFFPLFLEHLLSDRISFTTGSLLLGMSYFAPHLMNLYFMQLCQRHGVYTIVKWLFIFKLVLSVFMLAAGSEHVSLLCLFIASNRVFTEGTCKLLYLVVSDLVDEDFVLHKRRHVASAMLFGMVAFVTRPGQTLAPLLGTWLLATLSGFDVFQHSSLQPLMTTAPISAFPRQSPALNAPGEAKEALRQGCFALLVWVPAICGLFQLVIWSHFRLHGHYLQAVKSRRESPKSNWGVKDV